MATKLAQDTFFSGASQVPDADINSGEASFFVDSSLAYIKYRDTGGTLHTDTLVTGSTPVTGTFSTSFSGVYAAPFATNLEYMVESNFCGLSFGNITGTAVSAGPLVSTTNLPADARPLFPIFATATGFDNGSDITIHVYIDSTGQITLGTTAQLGGFSGVSAFGATGVLAFSLGSYWTS